MKVKALLFTAILLCGLQSMAYGQPKENFLFSLCNSQFHKVPARKEIRHKIKHHPLDHEQQQAFTRASGDYTMTEFPTTGEVRGLVLLVAYNDVSFSMSDDSIRALLQNRYDGRHYTEQIEHRGFSQVDGDTLAVRATIPGSAHDYFREMSQGRFTPSFDVVGPVVLDNPRSYYGANTASGNDKNARAMITEACRKAYEQELADFIHYDSDQDGIVDFLYVVYAGSDEAQTAIEECVWAHASTVSLTLPDGMKVKRYACSGELFVDLKGLPAGIGTFVHEFSHILGLPDFYNTRADDFTMDVWSVMDYGMYNRGGFVPCAYTAFERYSLGWLSLQTLDAPATLNIGTTDEEGKGYRIFTSDADTASFYMVETIRKEGWNKYACGEGLLISEVTYLKSAWQGNTVNAGTKHRHCIVPANNKYDYNYPDGVLYGTANHDFTLTTTPASITQFGVAMDKPLTDINYTTESGRTSFHFCGGNSIGGNGIQNSKFRIPYDLQGRPITSPTRGFYIQGGKKFLEKE